MLFEGGRKREREGKNRSERHIGSTHTHTHTTQHTHHAVLSQNVLCTIHLTGVQSGPVPKNLANFFFSSSLLVVILVSLFRFSLLSRFSFRLKRQTKCFSPDRIGVMAAVSCLHFLLVFLLLSCSFVNLFVCFTIHKVKH